MISPNGLLRSSETLPYHRFFAPAEFARYASLGEMAYVDSFRAPALAAIRSHPADFLHRIWERAVGAFGARAADESVSFTRHTFTPHDRMQLGLAHLFLLPPSEVGSLWLELDDAPDEVMRRMTALRLNDPPGSYRDWLDHRRAAAERRGSWVSLCSRLLLSSLPVFALGLAVVVGRGRVPAPVAWAALLHFATIAPYELVHHGQRQQFPKTALHALFLAALPAALVAGRRSSPS